VENISAPEVGVLVQFVYDNALALAKALQVVSERTNSLEAEIKKVETKLLLSGRGRQE
jgi:hypothetical protein